MFDFTYNEDDVISELGLTTSAPEFKEHVLARVRLLLEERVGTRVEEQLSDDELLAFQKIADKPDEAEAFMRDRFPDYQEIYKAELADIVAELKRAMAAAVAP